MAYPQIFTVLVTLFLFVLTCSIVVFSSREIKNWNPVDPPMPMTRPTS
jgi:hypothetical protein